MTVLSLKTTTNMVTNFDYIIYLKHNWNSRIYMLKGENTFEYFNHAQVNWNNDP